MNKYFIDVIKNHYFDFSGRATRTQFWMWVLWNLIISFVLGLVLGIAGISANTSNVIMWIYSLALFFPALGIAARRLKDGSFTPWLLLLNLVPVLGWIILLILYIMPSKR